MGDFSSIQHTLIHTHKQIEIRMAYLPPSMPESSQNAATSTVAIQIWVLAAHPAAVSISSQLHLKRTSIRHAVVACFVYLLVVAWLRFGCWFLVVARFADFPRLLILCAQPQNRQQQKQSAAAIQFECKMRIFHHNNKHINTPHISCNLPHTNTLTIYRRFKRNISCSTNIIHA